MIRQPPAHIQCNPKGRGRLAVFLCCSFGTLDRSSNFAARR
jgi:hypothetical protein